MCCHDIWWHWAWPKCRLPTLLTWIRSSNPTTLVMGTRPSPCLFFSGRFQVPTSLGTTPALSLPHTASSCSLGSQAQLPGPHGLWCPPPPDCEYIWLKNCYQFHLSSVECYVFGSPHNPRSGIPPSQTGRRGGHQNISFFNSLAILFYWLFRVLG